MIPGLKLAARLSEALATTLGILQTTDKPTTPTIDVQKVSALESLSAIDSYNGSLKV